MADLVKKFITMFQTTSDSVLNIPKTDMNHGIWQFKDDNDEWIAMNQQDSDNIHTAHQSQDRKYRFCTNRQFKRRKYFYEIDFQKMTQTNTETNKSRPIRYHIPPDQQTVSESVENDPPSAYCNDHKSKKEDASSLIFDTNNIEYGGYQWQWLNDKNNKWCNYDRAVNDQLECCYLADLNSCVIEINNSTYEVHFDKKEQVNASTLSSRKIRRTCTKDVTVEEGGVDIDGVKSRYQWQCWLSDKGGMWCNYNTKHNAQLERCYQSNQRICGLKSGGNTYKVYVDEMIQTNAKTNVSRKIQRKSVAIEYTEYIWEWRDNDKQFKRYPPAVSNQLEAIYVNKDRDRTSVIKTFGSQCYKIKPLQFKQINKATQFSRAIRRVNVNGDGANDEDDAAALWQWKDDGEIWTNYDAETSKYIESKYKMRNEKFSVNIGAKKRKYEIDLKDLQQTNLVTKGARHIRRIRVNSEDDIVDGQRDDVNQWRGPLRKTYGNEIKTLYHVTGGDAAQAINKTKRIIGGRDGMFGGGIYFAETVPDAQHKSENKGGWLITAKVFTGKALILQLQHGNPGKYDFNSLSNEGFDSIYAPKGGGYGKPEWCVFNWDQVLVVNVDKMDVSRQKQRKSVPLESVHCTDYIWEWRDNDKKFRRYPHDISDELEAIYLGRGRDKTSVIKTFGSQCYEIKPMEFKQINKATQFSRAIRRVWKNHEIWKNYDTETSKSIESKHKRRNKNVSANIAAKKSKYEIDLQDVKRTNVLLTNVNDALQQTLREQKIVKPTEKKMDQKRNQKKKITMQRNEQQIEQPQLKQKIKENKQRQKKTQNVLNKQMVHPEDDIFDGQSETAHDQQTSSFKVQSSNELLPAERNNEDEKETNPMKVIAAIDNDECYAQKTATTIIEKAISSAKQLKHAAESWTEHRVFEACLFGDDTYTVTSCNGQGNEDNNSSSSEQNASDESGDGKEEEHNDHNPPNDNDHHHNNDDGQNNGNNYKKHLDCSDLCYECNNPLHAIRIKEMEAEILRLRLLLDINGIDIDMESNVTHIPSKKEEKSRDDSCKILLTRNLTKRMPQKIHESFSNVVKYMKQYTEIYDQAIYKKGSIQVIDYKIHCKETQQSLYVICKQLPRKQNDTIAWKTNAKLYTATNLVDDYKICTDDLPKAALKSSLSSEIESNLQEIKSILMDVEQRNAFVSRKQIPWNCADKVPIYDKSTRYGLDLILTKEEFVKRLKHFSDKNKDDVDLLPIIRRTDNGYKAEVVWIVDIGFNQNIAITLAVNENKKNKILMAQGIHLDIYDSHRLAHNKLNCKCLSKYQWNLDRLEIGESKVTKLNKSKICKLLNECNRLRKKDDAVMKQVLYYCDLLQGDLKNTQILVDTLLKQQHLLSQQQNGCQTMLTLNAMQLQQLNKRTQADNHQLVTQVHNISNNYNQYLQ